MYIPNNSTCSRENHLYVWWSGKTIKKDMKTYGFFSAYNISTKENFMNYKLYHQTNMFCIPLLSSSKYHEE